MITKSLNKLGVTIREGVVSGLCLTYDLRLRDLDRAVRKRYRKVARYADRNVVIDSLISGLDKLKRRDTVRARLKARFANLF